MWCVALIAVVIGLLAFSLYVSRSQAAALGGASAAVLVLLRTWRQRFAADVLIVLMSAGDIDSNGRRHLVEAMKLRV